MFQTKRDEAVFVSLASVFSQGLVHNGDHGDLQELLIALRALNADSPRLQLDEAQLCIRRNDWLGALHLLRETDAQGRGSPLCTALQAWCLHSLHDPEWQRHVSTVVRNTRNTRIALTVIGRFLSVNRMPGATGNLRADIAAALRGTSGFL